MDALALQRFEESPHLLDLLLQVEDVLDALDVYVFRHWADGEVVEGPRVSRHWIGISLLFPERHMPDPRFARRLLKHGAKVRYDKVERAPEEKDEANADADTSGQRSPLSGSPHDPQPEDGGGKEEGEEREAFWMVRLDLPRRLMGQINSAALDAYNGEVDVEDVQDAKDSGLNDESAFKAPPGSEPNPELAANAKEDDFAPPAR